jgi:ABC-type multidrug transport system ATPase subunit
MEILTSFGLADRADSRVSELSTGMRRICDLAAVVATEPSIVLLDEPTAGLAQREVEEFAPLLRRLRDDYGCSMLVVEHDMPMLMSLCDRIYCLEEGRVIAEGTPDEVRSDPRVIASYLGADLRAVERSGGTAVPASPKPPRRSTRRTAPLTARSRTNGTAAEAVPPPAPKRASKARANGVNGDGRSRGAAVNSSNTIEVES